VVVGKPNRVDVQYSNQYCPGYQIRHDISFHLSLFQLIVACLFTRIVDLLPCRSHSAVSLFSICQFRRFQVLLGQIFTHLTTCLDVVAIHTRRRPVIIEALGSLLFLVVVNVDDVKGVYVAGQEAEDGQGDVNEKVCAASGHDVDADWWHCFVVTC